jgi:hypothetical protein
VFAHIILLPSHHSRRKDRSGGGGVGVAIGGIRQLSGGGGFGRQVQGLRVCASAHTLDPGGSLTVPEPPATGARRPERADDNAAR